MKLQRFAFETIDDWEWDGNDEVCVTRHEMLPRDYGEYYRAADVDALLARMRAARAHENAAWLKLWRAGNYSYGQLTASFADARDALDALLAGGGS